MGTGAGRLEQESGGHCGMAAPRGAGRPDTQFSCSLRLHPHPHPPVARTLPSTTIHASWGEQCRATSAREYRRNRPAFANLASSSRAS